MLGICLNWEKCYIIFVFVVIVLGLVFKFQDLDGLLGDNKYIGIICVFILISYVGVEVGNCYLLFEQVFMNGIICGKDVFILLDWIIGGKDYVGKGWCMLIECLFVGWGILLFVLFVGNVYFSVQMIVIYSVIC